MLLLFKSVLRYMYVICICGYICKKNEYEL